MNESNTIPQDNEQPDEKSFFKIIVHSFFIVPFLIAVFCVLLFAGIHLLTREQQTAYDYLENVKTGGQTKRWQGAFELSRILANPELVPKEARFTLELISAFEKAKHDDPRTRQYIALAMGRTGNIDFVQPLMNGLDGEREESVPALIYALGMLGQSQAGSAILPFADHPDSRIRSIAIVALGNIADPASKNILKKHLKDPEPNVQWGAAVSLAKMNDGTGKAILLDMLDRQYWESFENVDNDEQNALVLTAVQAGSLLDDPDINLRIKQVSQGDPNMKVRAAAMAVAQ